MKEWMAKKSKLDFHRHLLDLRHIVVPDSVGVAVIPINGETAPIRSRQP
jgi:hypothetical protein